MASGWDCDAFALDDRIVVKRPKHADAEMRLRLEASLLALIRPRVTLPVPDTHLVEGPPLWSWHEMLPGGHLLAEDYEQLSQPARCRLGSDLGRFLAQMHRIGLNEALAAGATELEGWGDADLILARALPVLPKALHGSAHKVAEAYAGLGADPLGRVFGQFDGHGWNMAFDHQAQTLNGIYDFGDSGIGSLHQDFIYAGFISFDLLERVVVAYGRESGRLLHLDRIAVLAGMHRLWELTEAGESREDRAEYVARFAVWADWVGQKAG